MMNRVKFFWKSYIIGWLGWANFKTSGCIVSVGKTIPVHLKPKATLPNSDYYSLYTALYNAINHLTPAYPNVGILTNIQSSRYFISHDYLHALCYRFYLRQHSLKRNLLVPQLLWPGSYALYRFDWVSEWIHQHNEPNDVDHCTVLQLTL